MVWSCPFLSSSLLFLGLSLSALGRECCSPSESSLAAPGAAAEHSASDPQEPGIAVLRCSAALRCSCLCLLVALVVVLAAEALSAIVVAAGLLLVVEAGVDVLVLELVVEVDVELDVELDVLVRRLRCRKVVGLRFACHPSFWLLLCVGRLAWKCFLLLG